MAYEHTDPPGSLDRALEPDHPESRHGKRTDLETREEASDEGRALAATEAASSDEAGQGLESIGDLTANASGVAKAPAVVMGNVGAGLGSHTSTGAGGAPQLEERIGHLETQMTTELNSSPGLHPATPRTVEKLRTARSLLQETETKGTLVERVQLLENRFTAYMESNDKALSIIQSKLAHIDTSRLKPAVHDAAELEESPSADEFHDAEQGSDNLESLETLSDQKDFEELDGVGSDTEDGAKSTGTTVLSSAEPQLASMVEEPQNVLGGESLPSARSSESAAAERDGDIAAEDSPLTSTVEEPQETVKEPVAAASTVELPESVQAGDGAGKSPDVLSSSEPQLASTIEEPLAKEPSVAEASAKLGEPEDMPVKELLPAASTVPPSEPGQGDEAGKSPAELSSLEPAIAHEVSAKRGEPAAQEDGGAGKAGSVLAGAEYSPLAPAAEEAQSDPGGAVMEDKHVQRESEYKAAEDVKVSDERPGSFTRFIPEPKPLGPKEKKKKEKKEKKQDGFEEEKSKQPFKHLRDRVKRAFKSN